MLSSGVLTSAVLSSGVLTSAVLSSGLLTSAVLSSGVLSSSAAVTASDPRTAFASGLSKAMPTPETLMNLPFDFP